MTRDTRIALFLLGELVTPAINNAADRGNFNELWNLIEGGDALRRILDHCMVDA